jgi:hypothetical protein
MLCPRMAVMAMPLSFCPGYPTPLPVCTPLSSLCKVHITTVRDMNCATLCALTHAPSLSDIRAPGTIFSAKIA